MYQERKKEKEKEKGKRKAKRPASVFLHQTKTLPAYIYIWYISNTNTYLSTELAQHPAPCVCSLHGILYCRIITIIPGSFSCWMTMENGTILMDTHIHTYIHTYIHINSIFSPFGDPCQRTQAQQVERICHSERPCPLQSWQQSVEVGNNPLYTTYLYTHLHMYILTYLPYLWYPPPLFPQKACAYILYTPYYHYHYYYYYLSPCCCCSFLFSASEWMRLYSSCTYIPIYSTSPPNP